METNHHNLLYIRTDPKFRLQNSSEYRRARILKIQKKRDEERKYCNILVIPTARKQSRSIHV